MINKASVHAYINNVNRRRRRIAADFTPASLGSLLLAHWSADDTSLITVTGLGVSSWKDRVGAYDMVQATDAARPPYAADSFGGAPGVSFVLGGDFLTLSPSPLPTIGYEVWTVVQQDTDAGTGTSQCLFAVGGEAGAQKRLNRVSGNFARALADAASTLTNEGVFSGRCVTRTVFETNRLSTQLNEGELASRSDITASLDNTRMRMGATSAAVAVNTFNGIVRDLIVTSILTGTQARRMQEYLLPRRLL